MTDGKKKVFVALSGGVDSAVSAALLLREGYDVHGVFIKIWQPEFVECTWREDRLDAKRVAAALGVPFYEIDLSDEYKKEVVDNMIAEYKAGRTPNPDVLCNRCVKFGALWQWAREQGADYIATGHHTRHSILPRASRVGTEGTDKAKLSAGHARTLTQYQLLRGADEGKDQSYFLWKLTQDDLEHILMPVGGMQKSEVRKLARKWNLPVSQKPDSQGLCMVGDVDMKAFLSEFIPVKKGYVIDVGGNVIGEHDGAALYTLGERHGFNTNKKNEDTKPLYVVATDVQANTVTVSVDPQDAARKEIELVDVNWVGGNPPKVDSRYTAQVRYRQKPQTGLIKDAGVDTKIIFDKSQIAASGQSCVLYDGDVCLGGGVIA